jgi:Domain of unknown function (DUF4157)
MIGQRYGMDLSAVPVDRSPSGAAEAQRMSARAFTSQSGVVIPARAGNLDAGPGAALLAHELTHVAQRARLGSAMPPEHSPAGQGLEAEARAAERSFAPAPVGRAPRPGATVHPYPVFPPGHAAASPEVRTGAMTGAAPVAGPAAHAPPGSALAPPAGTGALPVALSPQARGLDRADVEAMVQQMAGRLLRTHAASAAGPAPVTVSGGFSAAAPAMAAAPPAAAVQRAVEVPEMNVSSKPPKAPSPASPSRPNKSLWPQRPSDTDLARMARWLYPFITFRLRGELREGRERSGMVTDTYGRW